MAVFLLFSLKAGVFPKKDTPEREVEGAYIQPLPTAGAPGALASSMDMRNLDRLRRAVHSMGSWVSASE